MTLLLGLYHVMSDTNSHQGVRLAAISNNGGGVSLLAYHYQKAHSSTDERECGSQTVSPFGPSLTCAGNLQNQMLHHDGDVEAQEPLRNQSHVSVEDRLSSILDNIHAGEFKDIDNYMELTSRCRYAGFDTAQSKFNCNKATIDAHDAKFFAMISNMSASDNAAAHNALGVWWYTKAEDLVSERAANNESLFPIDKGDATATAADMLAFRLSTPGFSEAIGKSVSYFRRAEAKGQLDSGIYEYMVSNGWVQ